MPVTYSWFNYCLLAVHSCHNFDIIDFYISIKYIKHIYNTWQHTVEPNISFKYIIVETNVLKFLIQFIIFIIAHGATNWQLVERQFTTHKNFAIANFLKLYA